MQWATRAWARATQWGQNANHHKVKKILEDSLDSIPSPSVKIQIMGQKVGLS